MAAASVAAPAEPDAPGAAPQNTADQLLPARVGLPVARALFRGEADKVAVPATWASAHAVFWQHPTPLCAAASIAALTWQRLQLAPLTPVAALGAPFARFGAAADPAPSQHDSALALFRAPVPQAHA